MSSTTKRHLALPGSFRNSPNGQSVAQAFSLWALSTGKARFGKPNRFGFDFSSQLGARKGVDLVFITDGSSFRRNVGPAAKLRARPMRTHVEFGVNSNLFNDLSSFAHWASKESIRS